MTKLALLLLTTAATLAGCRSPEAQTSTKSPAPAVKTSIDLPEPPPPTRATPSDADVKAIEPVANELATRADAGDRAFIAKLMPDASPDAAADMIERLKVADVRNTFRKHLAARGADAAGLNYHDPVHVQVDLKRAADGTWQVARLWFCR